MSVRDRIKALLRRVDSTTTPIPYFTLSEDRSLQRRSISGAGALYSTAFLAAEQAKARAFGSLPVHVIDSESRGKEKHNDHPVARLVKRRWNPFMTAQTGFQWLSVRRDTFGVAYVRVEWRKGVPVAFWPISATVEVLSDGNIPRYRVGSGDAFTKPDTYLAHEMMAFPTCISTDGGVSGRSLAELGAADIGLSVDLTRFYGSIIGKGFHPGGWLEHPDDLSTDDVRALAEKNKLLSGPDHAGELRIFDKGLKYHQVTANMAEADIIKQQEFVLQSVIRACYVQPSKVFDFSRATYSNIEEANIAFVTDTVTPEVTGVEAEFHKLFDYLNQPNLEVKFELRGLLRGSFRDQNEGYRSGVYGGWYTRAEIREWSDLPYVEGTDELLQPTAYYTLDPATGEPKALPAALEPVLDDARERIRKRVEKDGPTDKAAEFARVVLAPVAQAFTAAGVAFDIEAEIERTMQ